MVGHSVAGGAGAAGGGAVGALGGAASGESGGTQPPFTQTQLDAGCIVGQAAGAGAGTGAGVGDGAGGGADGGAGATDAAPVVKLVTACSRDIIATVLATMRQ